MVRQVEIEFETAHPAEAIELRLGELTRGGPFAVRRLTTSGAGRWRLTCALSDPGLAVGFGKVVELQALLAREFDLLAVRRLPAAS